MQDHGTQVIDVQKQLDALDFARVFLPAHLVSKLSGKYIHHGDLVLVEIRRMPT